MAIAAQLTLIDGTELRLFDRADVLIDGTIRTAQAAPYDAVVHNISLGGCVIETDVPLIVGDTISLGMSGLSLTTAMVTRCTDGRYACMFPNPLSALDVAGLGRDTVAPIATMTLAPALDHKFPVAMRAAIIVGAASMLWVAIIAAVVTVA